MLLSETLHHNLEHPAQDKMEYICLSQNGTIKTVSGMPLSCVEEFNKILIAGQLKMKLLVKFFSGCLPKEVLSEDDKHRSLSSRYVTT